MIQEFLEVIEFYRMGDDVDYLLLVVVPDIKSYDSFYRLMITNGKIRDASLSFATEQIEYTVDLPFDYMILDKKVAPTPPDQRFASINASVFRSARSRTASLPVYRADLGMTMAAPIRYDAEVHHADECRCAMIS